MVWAKLEFAAVATLSIRVCQGGAKVTLTDVAKHRQLSYDVGANVG